MDFITFKISVFIASRILVEYKFHVVVGSKRFQILLNWSWRTHTYYTIVSALRNQKKKFSEPLGTKDETQLVYDRYLCVGQYISRIDHCPVHNAQRFRPVEQRSRRFYNFLSCTKLWCVAWGGRTPCSRFSPLLVLLSHERFHFNCFWWYRRWSWSFFSWRWYLMFRSVRFLHDCIFLIFGHHCIMSHVVTVLFL